MKNFYGEKLYEIPNEFLLEASPFHKDTRINFLGNLTPEIFFKYFFVESIDISEKSQDREVLQFTKDFYNSINTTCKNKFSKVDMIHIEGYGGCGKTTFIRHLLWKDFNDYKLKSVIDFAGKQRIEKTCISALSNLIYENFYCSKILSWSDFEKVNMFETRRFGNAFSLILKFAKQLQKEEQTTIDDTKINAKLKKFCENNTQNETIAFLLRFYFLVQLLENILNSEKPMVVVFDNVDSIDNIEEERNFVLELRNFIIDCNFFFGLNLKNNNTIFGKPISDIVSGFKMICFLTTRIVTFKKIVELVPDMEELYGWQSYKFPNNYFNPVSIIDKKINYYLADKNSLNISKYVELSQIQTFTHNIYKSNIVNKLFNGNIRFSMKAICNICNSFQNTGLINECEDLFEMRTTYNNNIDGALGIVISLVLNYFKENEVYDKKLHLSKCLPDNKLSLSRMLLTILREKNKACSMAELFDCLSPFFDAKDICDVVYDMSESKRDVWRRLLVFSKNFPIQGVDDLYKQKDLYFNNDRASEKYTVLEICDAGEAYLDVIVPHFEFMLSRHNEYNYSTNENYHPLFSRSSEDLIESSDDVSLKYRFERKIDWVYNDVKDCCKNSQYLTKKIKNEFEWDDRIYLNYSYYNYRSKHNDDSFGIKQDYVSRLIFGHIGYIERYRRYLMHKYRNDYQPTELYDINKRLVERVKRYLDLYINPKSDEYVCCHTERQDEAAQTLINCINKIEASNYKDIDIIIEVVR